MERKEMDDRGRFLCEKGDAYFNGEGVKQNYEEDANRAVSMFRMAADLNNKEACHNLGKCYSEGIGVEVNAQKAFEWHLKAAEMNSSDDQQIIAMNYEDGEGVHQNYTEAAKWYRRAAEQGNTYAQYKLGCFYRDGKGVAIDIQEARRWFRCAAVKGDVKAQTALGIALTQSDGKVEIDFKESFEWIRKAAEQGDSLAEYTWGIYCLSGIAVPEDRQKARQLLKSCAFKNDDVSGMAMEKLVELGLEDLPEVKETKNKGRFFRKQSGRGDNMLAEKKDRMFWWLVAIIMSGGILAFSYIMLFQNIPVRLVEIEQEIQQYEGADLSLLPDDELIFFNPTPEEYDAFQLRSAYKKLEATKQSKQICGILVIVSIIGLIGSCIGMLRTVNKN